MTFHGKERESDFDKMRARSGIEIGQKGQSVAMAARRCRNERSKDRRKRKREGDKKGWRRLRVPVLRRRRQSQGEGGREAMSPRPRPRREGLWPVVEGGRPCCIVIRAAAMSQEGRQRARGG